MINVPMLSIRTAGRSSRRGGGVAVRIGRYKAGAG